MLQVLLTLHVLAAMWFGGGMMAFVLLHMRLLKTNSLVDEFIIYASHCNLQRLLLFQEDSAP